MFDMNKMNDLLTKIKNLFVSHTSNADIHTSATEKAKLAGIANNANNYSLPSATQNNLGGVKTGYTINGKNYPILVDTSSNAYVNVPWTDTNTNTWRGVQDNLISTATDQSLSANQGRILKGLVDGKQAAGSYAASSHTHTKSQITDFPSSMPSSDVYSWAKSSSKPTYTYSEVGAAASLHTHNYAGSSSVGGAANRLYYFKNTAASDIGIDDVTANGIGYVSGTSGIFGQGDGAIYKQTYSSSWSHQIYGDYRTGQIAVRGKNKGTWQSWRRIFDSSNYTSYVPTKTGSGASGSWGISITGSSSSCTGNSATATSSTKATQDESGNNIKSSYASSLSASGSTLTLKSKSGATLSTVTISTQTVGYPTFVSKAKPTTVTANSCFIKLNT